MYSRSWINPLKVCFSLSLFTVAKVKLITNTEWAWALVPTKLVEPGNALAWGGIHGNPASGPDQAPSHWTIQWNTYRPNTYLAHTSRGREGWEKLKHKLARKQQAIATTLCKELQAGNCVYKSGGAPGRGIGPPLLQLGKKLTSIASRLTLPKLHLATLKWKKLFF